jgi:hypothetical protein
MFTARFDPKERIVWVNVRLFGPLGHRNLRFVLDSGTPMTTVDTTVIDELGYGARMGNKRSRSVGMGGAERGYTLSVSRLEAMGLGAAPFEVACADFPSGLGVDGVIGMDLLDGHLLLLDCLHGVLTVAS